MDLHSTILRQESWNELYEAAVFELNPIRLIVRVDSARSSINARLEDLNRLLYDTSVERRRLTDALRMLDMLLKIETMNNHKRPFETRIA